jgi:hypothetical protein
LPASVADALGSGVFVPSALAVAGLAAGAASLAMGGAGFFDPLTA